MKYPLFLGCTVLLLCWANGATAKTSAEVESTAKAVSVEIKLSDSVGSGIIAHKQGDLYTVITNRHVACGGNFCTKLPVGKTYSLGLGDGQKYQVTGKAVKLLGQDLDLAIIQFRSSRSYPVAEVAKTNSLKSEDIVYTAGYPLEQPGFSFNKGKTAATINRRLMGDRGGYTVVYDAETQPGMSGGGVFDQNGKLVAIHGVGDRYKPNTVITTKDNGQGLALSINPVVGLKVGYNRGIAIRWVVGALATQGVRLGNQQIVTSTSVNVAPNNADEYFITGFNTWIDPGQDIQAGKQQAIQKFSQAIRLNPRYATAYAMRADTHEQLQNYPQALADYNQAIAIDPQNAAYYHGRAIVKKSLKDIPGALADIEKALAIRPKFANTYAARSSIRQNYLQDVPGALSDLTTAITLSKNPIYLATYYASRAQLKTETNNDAGALSDYDQAIKIDPKAVWSYLGRGVLKFQKLRDFPGALADFDQAIAIDPSLAISYYARGLLKELTSRDTAAALLDYNQAIALAPNNASFYATRAGLKFYSLQDFSGALADYDQAIVLDSKNAKLYNSRGFLKHWQLKNLPGALADYNQAITLNNKFTDAYRNRGTLKFLGLQDFKGAMADFDQAIALDPKNFLSYTGRASLRQSDEIKDYAGALADLNQAVTIDPKLPLGYSLRGFHKFFKLKDYPGALADYNQVISLGSKDPNIYFLRGILRIEVNKDQAGALADYNQSIALGNKDATIYRLRGSLKERIKDYPGALADYSQAIKLNPQDANAYLLRGALKSSKLKDIPGALTDYDQVIVLQPNSIPAYVSRAILKSQLLNNSAGALQDFDRAIALDPKSTLALYNRGDFHYSQDNLAKATADFQQVIQLDPTNNIAQGIIAMNQRRGTQAINYFNKAQQQSPDTPDIYKYRGLAYQQQGKKAEAVADWQKAAQLYQQNNVDADYRLVTKWLKSI
jgi:tetratricopeptide (TPR) repeat protein